MDIMTFALICGAVGVVYGLFTTTWILKQDAGNPRMQEISAAVREGANAFLNRQYKTVAMVGAVVFVLLFALGKYTAIGFVIGDGGFGPGRLRRHVRVGAEQRAHRPGGLYQHGPRSEGSLPGRLGHRHAGSRPGPVERGRLLQVLDDGCSRTPEAMAARSGMGLGSAQSERARMAARTISGAGSFRDLRNTGRVLTAEICPSLRAAKRGHPPEEARRQRP